MMNGFDSLAGPEEPRNFIYLKGAEQGWVGTEVPCSEDGEEGKV